MTWVAVAIVGGAVIGGVASESASKRAAGAQVQAAQQASNVELQKQQEQQAVLQPYVSGGQIGLNQLTGQLPQLTKPFTLADFQASPAYQFNLQQGQQAINKAAASRGMYYAPQTLQDIGKFSQGLASNEFQNAFQNYQTNLGNIYSRLYNLSGLGESAAAGVGAGALQAGGQVGQNILGAGNAQAAGIVGQANAFQTALGQGTNAYFMNQMLTQQDPYATAAASGAGNYGFGGVGASPY